MSGAYGEVLCGFRTPREFSNSFSQGQHRVNATPREQRPEGELEAVMQA
jgi:hypothetical protein